MVKLSGREDTFSVALLSLESKAVQNDTKRHAFVASVRFHDGNDCGEQHNFEESPFSKPLNNKRPAIELWPP